MLLLLLTALPALFLLPVRPENSDPAVRVKIALTLLQECLNVCGKTLTSQQTLPHLARAGAWPDQGLCSSLAPAVPASVHVVFRRVEHRHRDDSAFLRLQNGAAGTCRLRKSGLSIAFQMNFYSAYVTTMLLPLGALVLCGTMWCVFAPSRATSFSFTRRSRRRLAYYIIFEKFLSRGRIVPLVLAGRTIRPAAPALTDEQRATTLHAFKVRCVHVL